MTSLTVSPAPRGLHGRLRVPGDKSISHRALLLAALADGTSVLQGLAGGDDVVRTRRAVVTLGAEARDRDDGTVDIRGGRVRLHPPEGVIDTGNSGTAIRLLVGVCASLPWRTVLDGDESVRRRPMERVALPLREMGARVDGVDGDHAPLVVEGGALRGIEYRPPVASAQLKSAVLLAGLAAEGTTVVHEDLPTRAHTEELLVRCGADLDVRDDGLRRTIRLRASKLAPFTLDVPGDPSQAAFWVVAATLVPASDLVLEDVYVGRARAGFLAVLQRMGAHIEVVGADGGRADVRVRHSGLRGTVVSGDEVPGVIDEIPALAVAAAAAEGTTVFRDAAELRVKETDRVKTTAAMVEAFGAEVEPQPDGMVVTGQAPLRGDAHVDGHGDHRVAMAGAIAALAARGGPSTVEGWEAVATSYPDFEDHLRACAS